MDCKLVIHIKQPLNKRCHMGTPWIIPFLLLHAAYVTALVGLTGAVWHVEFRFDELKDLWQGIFVCASSIGVLTVAYILNEVHDNVLWLQVASRFVLLVTASILVVAFFSMSSSQPLLAQISLRRRSPLQFGSMEKALGIPDSGLLTEMDSASLDPNEPLDKLLLNRRFRESFMEFADSLQLFSWREHELAKISLDDSVRRIYMARHIIENYIVAGSKMEVNISHWTRQEILNTSDLVHPHLFDAALNEVLQLMKTSLAKDYWSSMFFIKFKEEASRRSPGHERTNDWNFSPRTSSVQNVDNPFQHDHFPKSSSIEDHDRNNASHRHGERRRACSLLNAI